MKHFFLVALLLTGCSAAPPPVLTQNVSPVPAGDETATLAGGCFWARQSEFQKLKGVDEVVAGYAGGNLDNPSYEQVCSGTTGHAESIRIRFDPKQISYAELVHIFLTDIDPTTLNRQGPDSGTQYRSVIFYEDPAQKAAVEKTVAAATKLYSSPIVTEIAPAAKFYAAENYHQNYYEHNPTQPYCARIVRGEVDRFLQLNAARLKPGLSAVQRD